MLIKVLVLGRPGSGKTTAIQELHNRAHYRAYSALSIDDYDILSRMSQEDTLHEKFRATEYGGFDVLDHSVFDTALEALEKQVQTALHTEKDGIITIEFARNDYRQALRRFSPDFLQDAYIFFVEADLHTCIQRIHERITKPTQLRQHFVSNYIMQTYYSKDNWTYVTDDLKTEYNIYKTVATFYNTGSITSLIERVHEFAEHLFAQEFQSRNYTQADLVAAGNPTLSRLLSR
jgi:adenylate kinase family enzyme